jgi:ankyrin repeat protein
VSRAPLNMLLEHYEMSAVTELHDAVKRGDIPAMQTLLDADRKIADSRSETDVRGTFPLHVAAEFGQAAAARVLLQYGADVALLDVENDAIALCWAAFFGRPDVVRVLVAAGSDVNQRNKHGLTPLGCAIGGTEGRWQQFSNASLTQWRECADVLASNGGCE